MKIASFAVAASLMMVGACAHPFGQSTAGHLRELSQPDSAFHVSERRYYGIPEEGQPTFAEVEADNFPRDALGGRFGIEDFRIQVSAMRLRVDAIRTGDEDDSVEARHDRFVFERQNDEWRFVSVLARYRCYRGRPGVWTSNLCP